MESSKHVLNIYSAHWLEHFICYGGVMDSTPVADLEVHAEMVTCLVNTNVAIDIVANDETYAQKGALAA